MTDILHVGHPTLRQSASRVPDVQSPKIQTLIDNLFEAVRSANGVGIAAPQVNISLQIMIIASRPNPRYPDALEMEPIVLVNPQILDRSPTVSKGWEGCLSVPQYRALIPRYQSITVEYTDRTGQLVQCTFTDFIARIFQHEYDHFLGLVFLDRLESEADLVTVEEFKRRFPEQST